ncbi:hypothetical protein [Streptomyces jeddahensis]|uniref:Lipoprotein n=1 Tax=Streptomyces jeddahensis TaxID=1716141 RepID=A0A177HZ95_9ACTN|nr:hypothetical protein [Streptomyces jeddahensis]OAH15899.1 hypothetical protein STSP_07650 [Streptomyces jeddahensis]
MSLHAIKQPSAHAWPAAALAILAAAGCTTAASADRPDPSRSAPAARELTHTEQILVQRAEALLVKECMAGEGFRYWVGPLPTVDDLKGGGYVVTDVDWAKRQGYGGRLSARLPRLQREDPNHAYTNGLSHKEALRYDEVLNGGPSAGMLTVELPGGGTIQTPRRSCQTEAKQRLYGDFETWFKAEKIATNLTDLYVPDLLDDKRFTNAVGEWAACMRAAGHEYAEPPAIRAELPALTEGLSSAEAHAVEVRLAVAEARCATRTPLAATARKLDEEYRGKRLGAYREDIATYRRMRLTALARAEDIAGGTA